MNIIGHVKLGASFGEEKGKVLPYVDVDTHGVKVIHPLGTEMWVMDYVHADDPKEEEKTEPLNDFEKAVYNVCIDLAQTLIKKNRDYGDSYSKLKNEYGDLALIIRQSDKLERLKTLQKQDNLVNESRKDTKLDGAGYYILDLAYEKVNVGE